jgi:hypothetical protein
MHGSVTAMMQLEKQIDKYRNTFPKTWLDWFERHLLRAWERNCFDTLVLGKDYVSWGTSPSEDWTTVMADGSVVVNGECAWVPGI